MSLSESRPIIILMVIEMNEVQMRALRQVRAVLVVRKKPSHADGPRHVWGGSVLEWFGY